MKKILFLFLFSAVCFVMNSYAESASAKNTALFNNLDNLEKIIIAKIPDSKILNIKAYDTNANGGVNSKKIIVAYLAVKAADHSDAFVIITPEKDVIDIDDYAILSQINIRNHPQYVELAKKFPNISLWPNHHQYPEAKTLADNTTQLIFNYRLLNGCHACAIGGVARIGFNFDSDGKFLGAVLLALLPPPLMTN